eukprot:jgi/Mesvir1/27551/Mv07306-RA.2
MPTQVAVKYTDIDYTVFSDAASLVAEGRSPYERDTYRYSPLLAFLMLPNVYLHPSWGKLLFSAADLVTGTLLFHLLRLQGVPSHAPTKYVAAAWLFNPFTLPVATRGNADSLISSLVLAMLFCCLTRRVITAALLYGLLVHLRIYPVIYGLPILFFMRSNEVLRSSEVSQSSDVSRRTDGSSWSGKKVQREPAGGSIIPETPAKEHAAHGTKALRKYAPNRSQIKFGVVSAATFLLLGVLCWRMYGMSFVNEAFVYHMTRKDPRHNFSMHFYPVYLRYSAHAPSMLTTIARAMISTLPQAAVLVVLASTFYHELPLCFFLQTLAFVAFNKVCTAQYFVWYFCLLPLVLASAPVHRSRRGLASLASWGMTQGHWLFWAYRLEFLGESVFLHVWVASVLFFCSNVWVICEVILHHTRKAK